MSAERLGPFLLRQPPGVFPLGEDALRLAAFATVRRSWKVCDLGTGSGCLLLLHACVQGCQVAGPDSGNLLLLHGGEGVQLLAKLL